MSLYDWLTVAWAAVLPPVVSALWGQVYRLMRMRRQFMSGWMCSAAGGLIVSLWDHDWPFTAGAGVSGLVALAIWWWRRKKRRSVTALIGEKSKALRAALVRKMRESARPRPVLRPVPGGAR